MHDCVQIGLNMEKLRNRIKRPFTIKIEFTRGCNFSCKFCPIDVLKMYSKNKKFLDVKTCMTIAKQIKSVNPDGRIELTMRGEPTLNPDMLANLTILRSKLPNVQISMFTNGALFFKNPTMVMNIIDAGVNILNIDCYNGTYDRFHKIASDIVTVYSDIELKDFRTFSAYKRHKHGNALRVINLVPDIQEGEVDVRQIHNNAGNVNPEYLKNLPGYVKHKLPMERRCARPFHELVVTYDGEVLICCQDWQAEYMLGNVFDNTLEEIWWGKEHWKILRSLYKKDRGNVTPCDKCDYKGGYRLGLLHNPYEDFQW